MKQASKPERKWLNSLPETLSLVISTKMSSTLTETRVMGAYETAKNLVFPYHILPENNQNCCSSKVSG